MHTNAAPGSLRPVETVAPWLVLAGCMTGVVMCLTMVSRVEEAGMVLWATAIPALGGSLGAYAFARRDALMGWASLFTAAIVQALIATCLEGGLGAMVSGIVTGLAYLLVSPALVMAWSLGKRPERDAGDTMLLWGGVWSAAVHLIYVACVWNRFELPAAWVAGTGLVASCVAIGAAYTRAENRRRFVALVCEGRVPGYRVRPQASLSELRELPALFQINHAPTAVLERMTVSIDGTAYRRGLIASPVALVPTTPSSARKTRHLAENL